MRWIKVILILLPTLLYSSQSKAQYVINQPIDSLPTARYINKSTITKTKETSITPQRDTRVVIMPRYGGWYSISDRFTVGGSLQQAWWGQPDIKRYNRYGAASAEIRFWFIKSSNENRGGVERNSKVEYGHFIGLFSDVALFDMLYSGGFRNSDNTHLSYGISYGYRFKIHKKLTLTADVGIGYIESALNYSRFTPTNYYIIIDNSLLNIPRFNLGISWMFGTPIPDDAILEYYK